jgi:hypothetical protein
MTLATENIGFNWLDRGQATSIKMETAHNLSMLQDNLFIPE